MNSAAAWLGWIPIRMYTTPTGPWLDWCFVGENRFSDPFFDHSIERFLRDPFRLLFRRQTPIETCLELNEEAPGLEPSGFIFHMSRCGSTLVAQMLAASPAHIVVSEANIFETVLRTGFPAGEPDGHRVGWLRAIVSAMSRPRAAAHSHFFVKFGAWHTVYLPLIQTAFPTVPWIFVYRDPVEVLVSLSRRGGGWLVPGRVDPRELGLDSMSNHDVNEDQWHARILARICKAAITANSEGCSHTQGPGLFLNYAELPEVVIDLLPGRFGFLCPQELRDQMRARARFHGKDSGLGFRDDSEEKQRASTDSMRESAGLLHESYEAMEAFRRQRG